MKSFIPVKRLFRLFAISVIILVFIIIAFYTLILPKVVSSKSVINFVEEQTLKSTGAELTIVNPELKTGFRPGFSFDVDKIALRKENEDLLVVKDFKTEISFAKLLKNEITFKTLGIDDLFVDVDKIMALIPAQEQEKKETKPISTKLDIFNSKLYINNCKILASLSEDTKLTLNGRKMLIEEKRNPKHVRFIIDTVISKNGKDLKISLSDNNKFYTDKRRLIIEECPLDINKSRIIIKSMASEKKYAIVLESNNFSLADGANLLGANLFINNGSDIIAETKNLKGHVDFKLLYTRKGLNGDIKVKDSSFNLRSLADMPVNVTGGHIDIKPDLITLEDFTGYYAGNKKNTLTLTGTVTDYYKSVDTKIDIKTIMTDDFTRRYLSKLAGCSITMTGEKPAGTLIKVFSKYNNVDVVYMAKLAAGNDILIEGASLSPTGYDRAVAADIHLKGNILNIENIRYYIAKEINKGSKVKPILTIFGEITFFRTFYKSKLNGKCFCYVDRLLNLPKYDYFDPYIKAEVLSSVADDNYSKTAKYINSLIGNRISLNEKGSFISRQTVRNIILKSPVSTPNYNKLKDVDTLYILGDEKWIPTQNNNNKKDTYTVISESKRKYFRL